MIRFLHAADIHLDSPLLGLVRYEGCPAEQWRRATRRALENLVRLAVEAQVDFVLIAGDLFDGDWPDYNTGLYFNRQLSMLRDAKIPVYVISGNHDAQSRMSKDLRLPDNVFRLDTRKPETVEVPGLPVVIHGQGFHEQHVFDDLSANYPPAIPGVVNVGLLHTSLTGAEGHVAYAPCKLDGLRSKDYDYWALGHVHTRRVVHTDPLIVFPGNIQGRNIRETGPRGCMLVEIPTGGQPQAEFVPLDVVRWEVAQVDAADATNLDELLSAIDDQVAAMALEETLPVALRLAIVGETEVHDQLARKVGYLDEEVRNLLVQGAARELWLEKIEWNTKPRKKIDTPQSRNNLGLSPTSIGPQAEISQLVERLRNDPQAFNELTSSWEDWQESLKKFAEVSGREASDGSQLLAETEAWLMAQLTGDDSR